VTVTTDLTVSRPSVLRRGRVVGAAVAALLVGLVALPGPAVGQSPSPVGPSPIVSSPVVPSPVVPSPPLVFQPTEVVLTLEPFATGFTSPIFVTGDGSGGGMLYVVEQPGRVWAVAPDGTTQPTPFLNLSDRVISGGEQGLLGLAFHPDYASNGRLFVDYTRAGDGATVISELRAVDGTVSAGTERVLMVIPQPYPNHNGGMLAFDAKGMLLIGMGDGGSGGDPQGNGQNRQSLLAKLLRIDVDGQKPYGIPADNPFRSDTATRPEIFALGLRNPWRFSVDRLTGDIFIGDVGQDTWEEVDVVPAGTSGQDFGWNITEGPSCFGASTCDRTGLTDPIATFNHSIGDCTVIGGYVYRGTRYPALEGGYVFGDYCGGELRVLWAAHAVTAGSATPVDAGHMDGTLVAFGQGDDGELYAVDYSGGRILHVVGTPRK
jgi:glucose/arabinose dehydrogenase